MVRGVLAAGALVAAMLLSAGPADAIAHGTLDGNRHPQTGALIAEFSGGKDVLCSGTLIAPRVFLTAGHCTSFLESRNMTDVWVTFDSEFRASSPLIHGSYVTHPEFGFSGHGGASDPHDQAVVLLDSAATGITPARLPTENFLNGINLRTQRFTAVGYGTVRETKKTGPHAFFFDGIRRFATQSFLSLQPAWLNLSMNPSTGSGGTCFGDSGGPHFLGAGSGETNLLVSLTVTGDSMCRATDKTYRLDTKAARDFLRQYVTLP